MTLLQLNMNELTGTLPAAWSKLTSIQNLEVRSQPFTSAVAGDVLVVGWGTRADCYLTSVIWDMKGMALAA